MRQTIFTSLTVLLLVTPAAAQELPILERNALRGTRRGVSFSGSVQIHPDATYEAVRRYADGRVERERGRASLDERALVLIRSRGIRGAIQAEAPGEVLRFERDRHQDDRIQFRAEADGIHELLDMGKAESTWRFVRRLLKHGKQWHYLLAHNRGFVDEAGDGLWIMRSRQPRPKDLLRFKADGGKTVLSLNGDQDKEGTLWVEDEDAEDSAGARKPVKVNLRDFIHEQGLEHRWFGLSASRAPTDAELVGIFRVLLDDSLKPIYLHCTGGADRTGVIAALYQIEFLGVSKAKAKEGMRRYMWAAHDGTEIQGAVIDLYQPGTIRRLLRDAGVEIPARYR